MASRLSLLPVPLILSLFLTTLPHSTLATAERQKCYGIDGLELDSTYGACKSSLGHSGCCAINRPNGSGDICLDSGLCMATQEGYLGTIWQSGCTDPTGKHPSCPRLCPVETDSQGLPNAWNIQTCSPGTYCCRAADSISNCCNDAAAPKFTTDNIGALQLPTPPSIAIATALPALDTPSAIPNPAPSSLDPSFVRGTAISTGFPFPQPNISPSTTACPQPGTNSKDSSPTVALVSAAMGGTLGATILILIGIVLWMAKRERHQRKLKEHYEEQFGQNFAYRRTVVVDADKASAETAAKGECGGAGLGMEFDFFHHGGSAGPRAEAEDFDGIDGNFDGRTLRGKESAATLVR